MKIRRYSWKLSVISADIPMSQPVREILQNYVRYQEYIDWEYAAMVSLPPSHVLSGEDTGFARRKA